MHPLLLTTVLAVAAAQQNRPDPIKNFCRRHQHQTCIIDSKLYINGGKVFYGGSVDNDSVAEQNSVLLWEDVRDVNNQFAFPPQYDNLTMDLNVPSTSGGVLWPDNINKLFYLFGGEYDEVTDVQKFSNLWFFDVIYNTWNKSSASGNSPTDVAWPAFGAGTVSDTGIAYYYGGYLSNKTVREWGSNPLMLNSLVSYDMNTRTWYNRTYDRVPRAEGTLHYLPASASGMLVYLGGVETNSSGALSFADMSQIQLFEINDNRWYTQKSSGDVPLPRRGACTGVVWAADRTSYNFYLWGGIGENGQAFDEAYILTLPSFQWMRIYPAPPVNGPNYGGKGWSSCNIVRDSQMIIIGGNVTNSSMAECDVPDIGGQHNLLLGQENVEVEGWWHAVRDDTNGYRVPDQIVALIGGDADGHATKTAPAQGWAIPSLSRYWVGTNTPKTRTATRFASATSTATPTTTQPTNNSTPRKTNVGAIAGGVVGGVVALAGIVALAFLCLRKRRKQAQHGQAEDNSNAAPAPHGQNMEQRHVAKDSVSQSSTMFPQTAHSPAYSPQGSPPSQGWQGEHQYFPVFAQGQQQPGEWTQHTSYPQQQTYYPPPPGMPQSPTHQGPHEISAELPDVNSPAAVLLDDRTPIGDKASNMHQPVPGHGLK